MRQSRLTGAAGRCTQTPHRNCWREEDRCRDSRLEGIQLADSSHCRGHRSMIFLASERRQHLIGVPLVSYR